MEIYRNSVQDLEFKFYVNRILTDTDTVPVVSISLNGTLLPARTVEHVGTGVYSARLLFADTLEEGEIKAEWQFEYNGTESTKTEYHNVITPYVDLNFLYSLEESDDEIRWAEAYSRNQIDRYTSQSFGIKREWIKVRGNGSSFLILPKHLVSMTNIYDKNESIWESTDPHKYGFEVTKSGFAVESKDDYYTNFEESAQFEIWGDFGYYRVPEDVSDCARMLVEDYLCKDKTWKEKYVKKLSNGDWSVEFDTRAFRGTGNSIVDAILSDYVWHRMIVI